ncbi:Gfo/Idh/MocA family oxidoreductase [Micrococcales bacterium 31B]|nr:Gfo/Idh/MocA family oxidoreductase [Micrococcales bacterium 31B]
MTTTLNVGVIGAGNISALHREVYAKHPRVNLLAVADQNLERAQQVASKEGIVHAYASHTELLANPEIDAVSVCTWNNSHASIAIDALRAGKHVLVEKPMAYNYEQAQEIEAAQAETGKIVQVGFVRRYSENCVVLKDAIDKGRLGEIYYAKTSLVRRVGNPGGWFADVERSGGGPLIDVGVHVIDLCWYLMGRPRVSSVSANAYHHLGNRANIQYADRYLASDYDPTKNTVEDMVNAMIRFENGASLLVDCTYSLHAVADKLEVEVFGTKGGGQLEPELTLAIEQDDRVYNLVPQLTQRSFGFTEGFTNEIHLFVAAALGEGEPVAEAWEGAEIMKILQGIYDSAKAGKEIRF